MNKLNEPDLKNSNTWSSIAALPPHSAERLCLSVTEFLFPRGYASETGGTASTIRVQLSRKGRAFPRCAAAKPHSSRLFRPLRLGHSKATLGGLLLVLAMFVSAGFVSGQSKTTSKAPATTDPTVTITLVRWPYT